MGKAETSTEEAEVRKGWSGVLEMKEQRCVGSWMNDSHLPLCPCLVDFKSKLELERKDSDCYTSTTSSGSSSSVAMSGPQQHPLLPLPTPPHPYSSCSSLSSTVASSVATAAHLPDSTTDSWCYYSSQRPDQAKAFGSKGLKQRCRDYDGRSYSSAPPPPLPSSSCLPLLLNVLSLPLSDTEAPLVLLVLHLFLFFSLFSLPPTLSFLPLPPFSSLLFSFSFSSSSFTNVVVVTDPHSWSQCGGGAPLVAPPGRRSSQGAPSGCSLIRLWREHTHTDTAVCYCVLAVCSCQTRCLGS